MYDHIVQNITALILIAGGVVLALHGKDSMGLMLIGSGTTLLNANPTQSNPDKGVTK